MSVTLHRMKNIGEKVQNILNTNWSMIEPPRPNGLKRFEVGDQTVWALNNKNAERKAKLYPHKEIIGE